MNDRPTFIVHLRPETRCRDPIKALRAVLKRALRDHEMRCVTIETTDSARITPPSFCVEDYST
jgi:hypothetical protein